MKLDLPMAERIRTGDSCVFSCKIPVQHVEAYKNIIYKSPEQVHVTIQPVKNIRSTGWLSSNHHFNGHCQQISNETGNDFADVKLYVKRKAISRGLPIKQRSDGSAICSLVDGEPLPISEADMDNVQCSWCIEEAHILAGELSIVLVEE